MKTPLDHIDWALLLALAEDPPRKEGWFVHELVKPMSRKGISRSEDTFRNRLRRLRTTFTLVDVQRVSQESGAPMAYSLTMQGWHRVAVGDSLKTGNAEGTS